MPTLKTALRMRGVVTRSSPAGGTPITSPRDLLSAGSVIEWTKTLDQALKLDFDTVIPGHGPVTSKAALLAYRNNIEKLRNRAAGLNRECKSQEEVGKLMIAEFGWTPNGLQVAVEPTGDYDGIQIGGRTSRPSFLEARFWSAD